MKENMDILMRPLGVRKQFDKPDKNLIFINKCLATLL